MDGAPVTELIPWFLTLKMSSCSPWSRFTFGNHSSLLCSSQQFVQQLRPLAFGKVTLVVFILTSTVSVASPPADTDKGRRKVVHVLGKQTICIGWFWFWFR